MTSFEDRVRISHNVDDGHPPTDLDYYSRPENYTGAQTSLQQFMIAAQKQPHSRESSATERRKTIHQVSPPPNATIGIQLPGDDDRPESSSTQERSRSRRGSVQISCRRGSIQLEIKRKVSGGELNRCKLERTRNSSSENGGPDQRFGADLGAHYDALEKKTTGIYVAPQPRPKSSLPMKDERVLWAKEKFRHAIKTVLILLKWISSLTDKDDEDKHEGRTFTDIASEAFTSDELKNSGLTFDVSQFKANREINISNEVKSILSIPSTTRSADQLQTALYGLQHLKSFAEYPLHMQEKLCKVAWFQQVPPKRIIIRQGHYAENFYFILAGHALVRILEKNPKTGEPNLRTATIMRKGTSFGELALLHHSRRTATVVSQDIVQLLTIGREDFFDIFMGGNTPGEIPDHIKFCSTIDFMSDWPIEQLMEHPEWCLFHFFKRGVVIVKDSNQSDWLYIIKSGSCQVIKQLKGVIPRGGRTESAKEKGSPDMMLPHVWSGSKGTKIDTGLCRPHTRARMCRTPAALRDARQRYEVTRMSSTMESSFLTDKNNHRPRIKSPTCRDRVEKKFVDEVAMRGPVFVQVEILKPKDVFGLTTIKFDDDCGDKRTSVSLVSSGAECIMLSKKFFMEHANEVVKKMLRQQIRLYPNEKTLQENLQTQVDWEFYKKRLIQDAIDTRDREHCFPS